MEARVDAVRQQWADAYRGLTRDPGMTTGVREQVEAVTLELQRRVGAGFTLGELAEEYDRSERWALTAISEHSRRPGWIRTASSAADAAFHLYARGARDYRP
jgi:hypothetical protein